MKLLPALVLIACCVLHALAWGQGGAPSPPPNTVEERVQACVSCHGQHGRGTSNIRFPRLAGKPAGYLFNQLVAFREGRRRYAPMNYLLEYLPDEALRQMAQYYAQQNEPYQQPRVARAPQAVLDRGGQLVQHGSPQRNVPPCMACHGPHLTGREPGIPALIGLHPDYIVAQLGAWRYGARTALQPDCMQAIASHLTDDEMVAIGAWLAAMPIPADTRPLPPEGALPLRCGSQPSR